nr:sce7726 family protein [Qipengyuania polymorpha]
MLRSCLKEWLADCHASESDTAITEELPIPRPSVRADVVVTNGRFAGYEIKSDLDSLSRLPRQVRGYSEVFERAFVVTTTRRVVQAKKYLPDWWGLIEIKPDLSVRVHNKGRMNPALNIKNVLYILPRTKLRNVAAELELSVQSNLKKSDLITAITAGASRSKILSAFRKSMKD